MSATQNQTAPVPHLTIVSHSDNEHPEADDIIGEILSVLKGITVLTPFVVSIISAAQSKTITIPAKSNG